MSDPFNSPPPLPGSLGIRTKRAWPTWLVAVFVFVALIAGMVLGHLGGASALPAVAETHLPPPAATTSTIAAADTSTTAAVRPSSASSATTSAPATTVAPATVATTSSLPTVARGTPAVLLPQIEHEASWTTAQFATASAWTVGWAYSCTRLTTGPAFQIYVVTAGAKAAQPLISGLPLNKSGTTPTSGVGKHILQIESNPYCTSAVKVVGATP